MGLDHVADPLGATGGGMGDEVACRASTPLQITTGRPGLFHGHGDDL